MKTGPVRTCVGCRTRATVSELLRVVAVGGVLIPDPRRRMSGRGASVHPDLTCFDLAVRRRAFTRAMRVAGELDPAAARDYVERMAGTASGRAGQQ